MSALDNLAANYAKTAYTTAFDMDKIIAVKTGTIQVAAPTAINNVTSTTYTETGVFPERYYTKGIFSFDGGVTWNDMSAQVPDLTDPTQVVIQSCDCYTSIGSSGGFNVIGRSFYNFVAGTGTARRILFKVALIASNEMGMITPKILPVSTQFTSIDRQIQKIALKGKVPFSIQSGVGNSVTVSHNLGYVPRVSAYFVENPTGVGFLCNPWGTYGIDIRVTTTDVTFYLDADISFATIAGEIQYRIYYEQ